MAKVAKSSLDAKKTQNEIASILGTFASMLPSQLKPVQSMVGGKLYELYALSRLLTELSPRGWAPRFRGKRIELKAAPGKINPKDPHFEIYRTSERARVFEVYTDIEVRTFGAAHAPKKDKSGYHEIDIVVVPKGTIGRPEYDQLALGIECKATANFSKAYVREVLGRRRELSLLDGNVPCLLDGQEMVPADPPSEYWFVYIDPAGDDYKESPAFFGVNLMHWQP